MVDHKSGAFPGGRSDLDSPLLFAVVGLGVNVVSQAFAIGAKSRCTDIGPVFSYLESHFAGCPVDYLSLLIQLHGHLAAICRPGGPPRRTEVSGGAHYSAFSFCK